MIFSLFYLQKNANKCIQMQRKGVICETGKLLKIFSSLPCSGLLHIAYLRVSLFHDFYNLKKLGYELIQKFFA